MVFPGFNEASGTSTRNYPHEPTASKPCRPRVVPTSTILSIGQRQLDVERRALALAPLGPDPPAVLRDDTLADGQADARALVAVDGVQALERAEDRARLLGGEADAVVGDREQAPAVAGLAGDAYLRAAAVGELHRVGDEVLDELAQPRGVALDGGQRPDGDVRARGRDRGVEVLERSADDLVERDAAAAQLALADLRVGEQVGDEVVEPRRRPGDVPGDLVAAGRLDALARQQLGELGDRDQRALQVVRGDGGEVLQVAVGALELGVALLQRRGHGVEAALERADLVAALDRNARAQVAARDRLGGAGEHA